ncbi:MAG: hypothetical protein COT89_02260 [Candidatus Colwellbacteria bacterium CG10_big_fil_rev_8_21_14_0_10_42_22]|uniref:DUF5652 domain-containing protein n=1 Tax=Candidatus Colwellbacteria bacterium CG10_big_fil_rev_8_21_14_0_10_42_22 TaxID=1974540 RepID=A0A2H0VFI4_9BACT|nr:MAG: hypothetical protein COT89_02260 [Candidatus Colwellbacteria bacterium CG10_big_fil_rev_8_21_14_0_10_42_22]
MFPEIDSSLMADSPVFWMMVLIQLWELPWKGYALWKAARNKHIGWFVALLFIHLAALIDIIYIFYFSEPKKRVVHKFIKRPSKTTKK